MDWLVICTDQIVKQKQYDLLHEAEHYRLVKAIGQLRPNFLQEVVAALRQAMVGLTRNLPGLKPVEWKARS